MMQQRGIYGVNGYVVTNFKNYRDGRLVAGIYNPNIKTCAVDFVGHSWFIEREYLSWMLAKPWSEKYKICGEDMTLSAAAKEHGIYSYIPHFPKNILSLWGELPEFSRYGVDGVGVHQNPANTDKMKEAFSEIHANGWRCLLEENPDYRGEFFSAFEQQRERPEEDNLLQILKAGARNLLPFFGKRTPIFLGERRAQQTVQKLFGLQSEDYYVLENERDEIETARLFEGLRQGAIHVFFTDAYNAMKPFLEQWGLREEIDFIDGRGLIIAMF